MATVDDDIEYWAAQLRAAIEQMGVQASVTERYNTGDLAVTPTADMGRDDRAHLIHALDIRGFTALSDSQDEYIRVDVGDARLKHDFVEVDG